MAADEHGLWVLDADRKIAPYSKIADISWTRSARFFATVTVTLTDGKTFTVNRLPKKSAANFADETKKIWAEAWQSIILTHKDRILSLAKAAKRLKSPNKFPAACLVEPYRQEAETLLRELPTEIARFRMMPEIRKDLELVIELRERPDHIRNIAIKKFLKKELARTAEFLDSVESNPLTVQQRHAVLSDEDATLVLAGAGSGKTSVITAKAAHLIKNQIRKPAEILLLAYANDAAEEMTSRVKDRCGEHIASLTFHKLANQIIAAVDGEKPPLADHASDDKLFVSHIRKILLKLSQENRQIEALLLRWFAEFSAPPRSQWDFARLSDYYEYIEAQELRSLQGERVRSFEELEIANWLCMNGIPYEYEPVYEHELKGSGRRRYQPDFRLTNSGVYVEHFGVRKERGQDGNERLTTAPCVDREKYIEGMEWKRRVHRKHSTILIETYSYEKSAGRLTSALGEKLAPYEQPSPIDPQVLLSRLAESGEFDSFSKILGTFLRHFKGSDLSINECRARLRPSSDQERENAFLAIFEAVYRQYQAKLGDHIDFEDMISRAANYVRQGRFRSPYRHLLVDEFQDISKGRADLLAALKKQHRDARVFAVGDDWQSIYRFAGSDIHVMRDFGRIFGGKYAGKEGIHRTVDLGRTFRSVDRIAHASRSFVLKNPAQIEKEVVPAGTSADPAVQIVWTDNRKTDVALASALRHLTEQNEGRQATVLLLGRYRRVRPKRMSQLSKISGQLDISFKTVHASKGLEADHVIILGADSGKYGFPSEIVDDPVLNLVLPDSEPYPHAEERRVFYVALTRARRTVTILASKDHTSCFVTELVDDKSYGAIVLGEEETRLYPCSRCGGHLVKRSNSRFTCEHSGLCEASLPSCRSCGGLPVRSHSEPRIYQCSCGEKFQSCPACVDGWLVERKGRYGRFFGCVNFPGCSGKSAQSAGAGAGSAGRSRIGDQ